MNKTEEDAVEFLSSVKKSLGVEEFQKFVGFLEPVQSFDSSSGDADVRQQCISNAQALLRGHDQLLAGLEAFLSVQDKKVQQGASMAQRISLHGRTNYASSASQVQLPPDFEPPLPKKRENPTEPSSPTRKNEDAIALVQASASSTESPKNTKQGDGDSRTQAGNAIIPTAPCGEKHENTMSSTKVTSPESTATEQQVVEVPKAPRVPPSSTKNNNHVASSAEAAPIIPTKPTDPAKPTRRAYPTSPAEPTGPVDAHPSVETTLSTKATSPAGPAKATHPIDPPPVSTTNGQTEASPPIETTRAANPDRPTKATAQAETSRPAGATPPTKTMLPRVTNELQLSRREQKDPPGKVPNPLAAPVPLTVDKSHAGPQAATTEKAATLCAPNPSLLKPHLTLDKSHVRSQALTTGKAAERNVPNPLLSPSLPSVQNGEVGAQAGTTKKSGGSLTPEKPKEAAPRKDAVAPTRGAVPEAPVVSVQTQNRALTPLEMLFGVSVEERSLHKRILLRYFSRYSSSQLDRFAKRTSAKRLSDVLIRRKRITSPLLNQLPPLLNQIPNVSTGGKDATRFNGCSLRLAEVEQQTRLWHATRLAGPANSMESFALLFNECTLATLSNWVSGTPRRLTKPLIDPKFRSCLLCRNWGHYEQECPHQEGTPGQATFKRRRVSYSTANEEEDTYVVEKCQGFVVEQRADERAPQFFTEDLSDGLKAVTCTEIDGSTITAVQPLRKR